MGIFLFALYLLLTGCSNDETSHAAGPGGQITPLECVNSYSKTPFFEYDYMYRLSDQDSFYAFPSGDDDYFSKVKNAFSSRGNVYLTFDRSFNQTVIGTRVNWRIFGGLDTLYDTLIRFWQLNRNPQFGYHFYLASIDSFATEPDRFKEYMGATIWFKDSIHNNRGASFVYRGKIRHRYCDEPEEKKIYTNYAAAHEIAHLLGLIHDNDERHAGNNAAVCLMRYTSLCTPDGVKNSFAICDTHLCQIYDSAYLNSIQGFSASNNIIKNNLKFILSTNKDVYIGGEPIIVGITITNKGNDIDSVSDYNFYDFTNGLKLTSNKKLKILFTGVLPTFSTIHYNKINPNESISKSIQLQSNYGTTYVNPESEDINQTYYFTEDIYTLFYKGFDEQNEREFESNTLKFEIIKPEGINLEIFNKMLDVFRMKEWFANRDEQVERYKAILKIFDTYPINPYTEKLFPELNSYYPYLDEYKLDIFDKNLWFIDNYPDSFFLGYIIEYSLDAAYKFRGGINGINDLVTQIKTKHPGSRASELAEQQSKKYK